MHVNTVSYCCQYFPLIYVLYWPNFGIFLFIFKRLLCLIHLVLKCGIRDVVNKCRMSQDRVVMALQFRSNTQSHWSSGSTDCFPSRGQRFESQGCTNSQWNWVSPVSAVTLHWWPRRNWRWPSPRLHASNRKLHLASRRRCEKPAVITHVFLQFHYTHCMSFSSSQHSDRLEPPGSPAEALQFHSNTQSHWFSGSTISFLSRGSTVCVPGMHKLTMELGFSC